MFFSGVSPPRSVAIFKSAHTSFVISKMTWRVSSEKSRLWSHAPRNLDGMKSVEGFLTLAATSEPYFRGPPTPAQRTPGSWPVRIWWRGRDGCAGCILWLDMCMGMSRGTYHQPLGYVLNTVKGCRWVCRWWWWWWCVHTCILYRDARGIFNLVGTHLSAMRSASTESGTRPYKALLYCTVLYCTVLYCTILYYTITHTTL